MTQWTSFDLKFTAYLASNTNNTVYRYYLMAADSSQNEN